MDQEKQKQELLDEHVAELYAEIEELKQRVEQSLEQPKDFDIDDLSEEEFNRQDWDSEDLPNDKPICYTCNFFNSICDLFIGLIKLIYRR